MMFYLTFVLIALPPGTPGQRGHLQPLHEWRATAHTDPVIYIRFSDDSKTLTYGLLSGELVQYNLPQKRVVSRLVVGREVRNYALISEREFYTLHADGTVSLRNRKTGDPIKTMAFRGEGLYPYAPKKDWVSGVMRSAGKTLLVVMPNVVFIVSYPDRVVMKLVRPGNVLLSVKGDRVAVATKEEGIKVYDTKTGLLKRQYSPPKDGHSPYPIYLNNGKLFGVRRSAPDDVSHSPLQIVDLTTGRPLGLLRPPQQGWGEWGYTEFIVSNTGEYVVVRGGYPFGDAWLFSLRDGRCLAECRGERLYVSGSMAFSHDDKLFAIYWGDGKISVYRAP